MPPEPLTDRTLIERGTFIRNQLPDGGLFADQTWRTAPEPFVLDPEIWTELETLGRVLLQFYQGVNLLYRQSSAGKQPDWIARWLDQGKSPKVLALQRSSSFKNELPRVIRPDLLITDQGLALTELDSVPGGIGLTAWLNRTYDEMGMPVIGGRDGMLDGFAGIFGDASIVHIVVSEESAAYRPEMEWVARELNMRGHCFQVRDTTRFVPTEGEAAYRFFELFDVENLPVADTLFEASARKRIRLTPTPRSFFEEKMILALLWNRHLRDFWHRELGAAFFRRLQQIVPYAWLVDPTPLPPHAALPELNLTHWQQLKDLSQRERDLVLKVSGYSPEAWGARGVYLGSDLSSNDWAAAVDKAIASFPHSPYILQRYEKPTVLTSRWIDFDRQSVSTMPGRVRLCPYYFVIGDNETARPHLGGVLATICPADKKIIHGMTDAILAPCALA